MDSVAIWENRSTYHTATCPSPLLPLSLSLSEDEADGTMTADDYEKLKRVGDRAVSIGEKPYFSEEGRSRREALGIPAHGD